MCAHVCSFECVHETKAEPERNIGMSDRAVLSGCLSVFPFLSERDIWTDVHTNLKMCIRVFLCMCVVLCSMCISPFLKE